MCARKNVLHFWVRNPGASVFNFPRGGICPEDALDAAIKNKEYTKRLLLRIVFCIRHDGPWLSRLGERFAILGNPIAVSVPNSRREYHQLVCFSSMQPGIKGSSCARFVVFPWCSALRVPSCVRRSIRLWNRWLQIANGIVALAVCCAVRRCMRVCRLPVQIALQWLRQSWLLRRLRA